jgi:hypothetical protein
MRKIVMSGLLALVTLAAVSVNTLPTAAATTAPAASVASSPQRHQAITANALSPLDKISCGSPKSCLAIGNKVYNSGTQVAPIAEVWNGTAWRPVAVPTPKPTVALVIVTDVSCKSATSCLVVGLYLGLARNGTERPYAMTWNGTSLTPTALPPVFKDSGWAALTGVSCVTAKSCIAVGDSQYGTGPLLVETWNGAKWTLRTARVPGGAQDPYPSSVSCLSRTSCVVAGESYPRNGSDTMLLARWNGKSFSMMKAAAPAGAANIMLYDVSCASATNCVAVGLSDDDTQTRGFGFAELWNGKSWTAHKAATPKGDIESFLFGVSCVAAGRCIAVGSAGSATAVRATALSLNGRAWTAQHVPGPGKGVSADFAAVSCPKADECVAIGEIGLTGKAAATPLGGLWNGSSWRLVAG